MTKKYKKAQSIVESVFAIGVLGMLLGGAVILIIMGVNNRRVGFDRKKAIEMINILTEELVSKSQNDPEHFWLYENNGVSGLTRDGFEGYTYSIGYTNISGNADYPGCGDSGKINCVEVIVTVDWPGKDPQTTSVSRFFSKR